MASSSPSTQSTPSSASDIGADGLGNDAIAIVGMACRLPGEVNDTSAFWDLLMDGRTAQCQVPASRFNIDAFYQANGSDAPGGVNHRGGYYLKDDIRLFDHEFFGILKSEAAAMDPQQRKLLEVVFECFEAAGIPLESLSGSETGCYVGSFAYDYTLMQMKDPEYLTRHAATGMGSTILSNRISHVFDLRGPSLTIDTACSSSLYCLHNACAAIEAGDCNAAVVAGANLIQSVEQSLGMMRAGVLSDTSACNTFTDLANGYARADGVGALFIKRLGDAKRDGDPIRAVIRASAVGANGRTAGISAPSSSAQEALIKKAYRKAGLSTENTTFIECHGTGTKAGDSNEVSAISRVFSRSIDNPLLIGSVKTNVGHSEAVSGLSGIIKTVLALEKAEIPPSYINGNIASSIKRLEPALTVVQQPTKWAQTSDSVRRAGVNSFGYGGANGHVILDAYLEAHEEPVERLSDPSRRGLILPISAASPAALDSKIADLSSLALSGDMIHDMAYTLGCRRTHFPYRGFALADPTNLSDALSVDNVKTVPSNAFPSKMCFVFTGQGAQWPRMGAELLLESPIFRASIKLMDSILHALPDPPTWTLEDSILDQPDVSRMHEAKIAQPAATALQVALVDLLASWNIFPSMVVGHSSGEIAASYAAGRITVAEAIISAYYRGVLNDRNQMKGAMMAVGLSQEESDAELEKAQAQSRVRVACVNSSTSTTWSGDEDAIDELLKSLSDRGVFARRLKTGGKAYHSHHMEPLGPDLERLIPAALSKAAASRYARTTECQFMSSVTGVLKDSGFNASYWRDNMESPVLFLQAVQEILKSQDYHYVEVGPHSALSLPLKQIRTEMGITAERAPYSTAITRGTNCMDCALNLAGRLFVHGITPSFVSVNKIQDQEAPKVLTELPRYPWQYQEPLSTEPRVSREFRERKYPYHELLGSWVPGGDGVTHSWRNRLQLKHVSWLSGHQLQGSVIFPAAGYISMAIEAALQIAGKTRSDAPDVKLSAIEIKKALIVPTESNAETELFTILRPSGQHGHAFSVVSVSRGNSSVHALGEVLVTDDRKLVQFSHVETPKALRQTSSPSCYEAFADAGMGFADDFQSLKDIRTDARHQEPAIYAQTALFTSLHEKPAYGTTYPVHPVTIDAMLQAGIVAKTKGLLHDLSGNVPVAIQNICLCLSRRPHEQPSCSVLANTSQDAAGGIDVVAALVDQDNQPFMQLQNVHMAAFVPSTLTQSSTRRPITQVLWRPSLNFHSHSNILDQAMSEPCASSLLDLLLSEKPDLRILELVDAKFKFDHGKHASSPNYTLGAISDSGILSLASSKEILTFDSVLEKAETDAFDIVIVPKRRKHSLMQIYQALQPHLTAQSRVIAMITKSESNEVQGLSLKTHQHSKDLNGYYLTLAYSAVAEDAPESATGDGASEVVVITPSSEKAKAKELAASLQSQSQRRTTLVPFSAISDETIPQGSVVISLVEVGDSLFENASEEQLQLLRPMLERAAKIVWVTSGSLLKGGASSHALASGVARSVRLEHPSLSFTTFDLEDDFLMQSSTVSNILQASFGDVQDNELRQQDGIVHFSRIIHDDQLDEKFLQMEGTEFVDRRVDEAGNYTLQLGPNASFESAHFVPAAWTIDDESVHIQLDSAGLEAMNLQSLSSKARVRSLACECSGTVLSVGDSVNTIKPGDRVLAIAPGKISTQKVVPAWSCIKLAPEDDAGSIFAYVSAVYALQFQTRLQAGESVLVTDAMSAAGQAAMQVAQLCGAQVYATVDSYQHAEEVQRLYGLDGANTFVLHEAPITQDIRRAVSQGRGADVVFATTSKALPHAFEACADFGRVVALQVGEASQSSEIASAMLDRGVTLSTADTQLLFSRSSSTNHALLQRILASVSDIAHRSNIKPVSELSSFDISDLADAVKQCNSSTAGRVTIDFSNPASKIRCQMPRHMTRFSSDKAYLLVGCLGGLGRTISIWMQSRGARHFIFLGRSGDDNQAAKSLTKDLAALGAEVTVVRGDVANLADVQRAAAAATVPIAGAVHAAMALDEALFTRMSAEAFHKCLKPKMAGAQNLHEALKDQTLDFLLFTSSVSGTVGVAAQANYCAANAFLDSYALQLRKQAGVPAVAVGLSMVSDAGFLAENPQAGALMARTGIAPLSSQDVIRVVDIALSADKHHILTGLDTGYYAQARASNDAAVFPASNDLRTIHLQPSTAGGADAQESGDASSGLPQDVVEAMSNGASLEEAVCESVAGQLATLLQIRRDRVELTKPLSAYGLDSMLATELRGWLWTVYSANVAFLELLADSATARGLAASVCLGLAQA